MQIPAVMFIEMALDALQQVVAAPARWPPLGVDDTAPKTTDLDREIHEFRMLGTRDDHLGAVVTYNGSPLSERERGYLIGLETARALLVTMPSAVIAKVTL